MNDDEKFASRPGMTDEVLYARGGRLRQIQLNRPKVINALPGPMVTSGWRNSNRHQMVAKELLRRPSND